MINEVLDVIAIPAKGGMTMIAATHEIGFAQSGANGAMRAPVLMPVTTLKAGRVPVSDQPTSRPAPNAPLSPPPEMARMDSGGTGRPREAEYLTSRSYRPPGQGGQGRGVACQESGIGNATHAGPASILGGHRSEPAKLHTAPQTKRPNDRGHRGHPGGRL